MNCKFCTDPTDFKWSQNKETKKWALVNAYTGTAHICKKNKPNPEISANTTRYKPRKSRDESMWKKDWKPEMDLPSYHLCGICNDGTELISTESCEYCSKFKLKCYSWCPKCKKHPMVSLKAKSKDTRLGK